MAVDLPPVSGIRILFADDHPIVRRGLKRIISHEPDMVVAGEADDGQTALDMALAGDWEVMILDINMPVMSGLEVLHELRRIECALPVLVLSVHPEQRFAVRCLKAGAAGYLTKSAAPTELVQAVRRVAGGGRYVGPELAEILAREVGPGSTVEPHECLTPREDQFLRLLGGGSTTGDIARKLGLSVKTVSTYRSRVLKKMAMKNNSELIRYAVEHDLVDDGC